jgi:hypothetical protein
VSRYVGMTMDSALVWHTQIMSSAIHIQARVVEIPTRDKFALMAARYRASSIKLLQAEIRRCEKSPVDDKTISAVLTLAVHEKVLEPKVEIHPRSPLATLTNLHIYGSLGYGGQHMNALYLLVERMGGLDHVDELVSRRLLQRYGTFAVTAK